MRRLFGARTGIEAVFLIAVPIAALSAGLSSIEIIAASAIAYLVVLLFETGLARGVALPRRSAPAPVRPQPRRLQQQPLAQRLEAPAPPPAPAPAEPEEPAQPTWRAEPVRTPQPWRPEPGPAREPEPDPAAATQEPDPSPAPDVAPAVQAAPPLPPEPEPEPEPAPVAPEPTASVIPMPLSDERRQWNVWELDRLSRERAGVDPARDEERRFLLMYLREFADPNGVLPVDFDGLVRDSFGDLIGQS